MVEDIKSKLARLRKKQEEPKVVKENTVTPKKRPIMKWSYTTREGGKKTFFKFPESESAENRMLKEVQNHNNWKRYPGVHPEGKYAREYTILTLIPGKDIVKIHSLFFPSGIVWDSTIRQVRKVRDIELKEI